MTARTLMVQATASSAGKSLLVTALCRILRDDGLRVAPFKAQNMSNNSYVTIEGGEIGRAQVNQAEAAGIEPSTDMNPILLKPESDRRSQIVLNGRPYRTVGAGEYFGMKRDLWPAVTSALDRLRGCFDVVVIEGAGSPAEINLRDNDIVNMRVAAYAGAPVLLAGDIDRGGVFAHLFGTLALLPDEDRGRVRALVINKFRGDEALLEPGLRSLEQLTSLPVVGVIPFIHDVGIAEEDAVALDDQPVPVSGSIDIAVIQLPHIANFDDFDPLKREPGVSLRFVSSVAALGAPALIILPGSKATVADLLWLRQNGLEAAVTERKRAGAAVIGICGGYQMLCETIVDRQHAESKVERIDGLGLLPGITEFEPEKATHQIAAWVQRSEGLLTGAAGIQIRGYEIHMGRTVCSADAPFRIRRPAASEDASDGAMSDDGRVLGTYIHGLFDDDALRAAILANLAGGRGVRETRVQGRPVKQQAYARLAGIVRASLNMPLVYDLLDASTGFEAKQRRLRV